MAVAKVFKHGGSQAVRLPKDYRFDCGEVFVERRGEEVVLRPKPQLKTLSDLVRHIRNEFPTRPDFPARRQPKAHQKRDLRLD
jgi:antitoxin VapB